MNIFFSNQTRSSWAIKIRYVLILTTAIVIISEFMEYQLLHRFVIEGFTMDMEQLFIANDMRQAVVSLIHLAVLIAAGILYLRWYRRAYNNLRVLDMNLQYKSWWTIGGWLIPIACLFIPYKIMAEFHQKTAVILRSHGIEAEYNIHLCQFWWGCFVLTNIVSQAYNRLFLQTDTIEAMQVGNIFYIVISILDIVTAVISIKVIQTYSKMENDLHEGIKSGRIRTTQPVEAV